MPRHRPRPLLQPIAMAFSAIVFVVLPSPTIAQQTLPDVFASGTVSARVVSKGQSFQFTIVIRNKADAKSKTSGAANSLRLNNLAELYQLQQICVLPPAPSQTGSCRNADQFAKSGNLVWDTLVPGQSITVQGGLKSENALKPSILSGTLVWDQPTPGSSLSVSLGENQVLDWYQADWITGLTKILAVPILLALITFALNLLASNKEKREAARQRTREQDKAEAEKEQAVRTETWKQMLLISHQYAAKCYLPLSLASDRLSESLLSLGTPDGDERVAFYYVLLCGKEMTKTRREIGGLYFKDLRGETLAGACWKRQREGLMSRNEQSEINLALRLAIDRFGTTETYASFKKQFEVGNAVSPTYSDPDIQQAWVLFQQWLHADPTVVADVALSLNGFSAILDYESNRPYKYWYPVPDRLEIPDDLKKLFRDKDVRGAKYTEQQIDDYIAGKE